MEQEEQKRAIYDLISKRRRKYVDRIGYENWDPFQEPKDPVDIRRDVTKRTVQELIRDFLASCPDKERNEAYLSGVREICQGVITVEDRCQGIYDFALWYHKQLQASGLEGKAWQR
jgi:hypothetical protein